MGSEKHQCIVDAPKSLFNINVRKRAINDLPAFTFFPVIVWKSVFLHIQMFRLIPGECLCRKSESVCNTSTEQCKSRGSLVLQDLSSVTLK